MSRFTQAFLLLALAASPFAAAQQCLPLTGSTACAPFANYQVYTSLPNLAAFDRSIMDSYDTNTSFVDYFKKTYGCPNYTGAGQRYHIGIKCGMYVDVAARVHGCNEKKSLMLCPDQARAALDHLQALFNSELFCTQGDFPERQNIISNYTKYVQFSQVNDNNQCVTGLDYETKFCGYFTEAEARQFCDSEVGKGDSCCGSIGTGGQSVIDFNPKAQTGAAAKKGLGTAAIIGIGVGAFLFLVIIAFLVLYFRRRRLSKDSSRSNSALEIAETYQVVYNYVPNLSDEIYLYVGDKVIVKTKFDDGWSSGYNMTTKQEGSFPLACVDVYQGTRSTPHGQSYISQRMSSLYGKYQP